MSAENLIGGIERRKIELVDYDPSWPERYRQHAKTIKAALRRTALSIEHVGSTSARNLAAEPIIDVVIVVPDSGDEPSYLPPLIAAGYQLRVREPEWHEHRMLRTPELDVHVHVFSRGCIEVERMLAFRDRLRSSATDRLYYEAVKRELAKMQWPDMNAYAAAKSDAVESILSRRP